jgi:hypothetical protein
MKALSAFYDLVMPELPGIETNLVDFHLVWLARDLCERASIWRADFDPADTVALQATYDVDPSESQSETVRLTKLSVNGSLLWDQSWKEDTPGCTPRYDSAEPPFTLSDDMSEITLIDPEIPDAAVAGGLVLTGAMKPQVGATQLPDILLGDHAECIRFGTLARLMRMSKKPWSDPQLAMQYQRDFEDQAQFSATVAQRGNTRAPLRTRMVGNMGPRMWRGFAR